MQYHAGGVDNAPEGRRLQGFQVNQNRRYNRVQRSTGITRGDGLPLAVESFPDNVEEEVAGIARVAQPFMGEDLIDRREPAELSCHRAYSTTKS
jgi:hypothetical protein